MTEPLIEPEPIDKSTWGDGPWQDEPDRVDWTHAGLPCLVLRNRLGVWCGYAAVPPGHPLYGRDYNDVDVDAHGGLTYSDRCRGHICHVPAPGEPDDVWWFGFDCGHGGDYAPGIEATIRTLDTVTPPLKPKPLYDHARALARDGSDWWLHDVYRTLAYAQAETERLAEQLAAVKADGDRHAEAQEP